MELNNEVELELVSDLILETDDAEVEVQGDSLEFPCTVIENITPQDGEYLINCSTNVAYSLPLFMIYNNIQKKVGSFELSLDYLLKLKFLNPSLKVTIHKSADNSVQLDLTNPQSLLNFIVL